jgi:hypothetical protein
MPNLTTICYLSSLLFYGMGKNLSMDVCPLKPKGLIRSPFTNFPDTK